MARKKFSTLLVVDDNEDIGVFIQDVAEEFGFETIVISSFKQFEKVYEPDAFVGIMLDLQMPDKDGLEYLRLLCDTSCNADIVLMSGYDARVLGTANRFGEAQGLNMSGTLQKPVRVESLQEVLERIKSDTKVVTLADIRKAAENWEFEFEYQPKVRLDGDTAPSKENADAGGYMLNLPAGRFALDSLEALIRWRHPEFGLLPPDSFIPLVEKSDLVHTFSFQVVDAVLRQIAVWQTVGFKPIVAINLPAHLAVDPTMPDRAAEMADGLSIPLDRIAFEVTETAAMENAAQAMSVMSRLRLKGFRLAMDDFGTGYSSLVQLHRMPFNELKIDKSIVFEFGANKDAEAIVRSIIDLAHNLGLEVCAEGVETKDAFEMLRDFNCDIAQGFYMSRPLPPAEITTRAGFENVPGTTVFAPLGQEARQ